MDPGRARVTARVKVPFHFKPDMTLADLDTASALHAAFNDDWLSSGFLKFFMDGVTDSRTDCQLSDYPGHPGLRSAPLFSAATFARIAAEADRRGLQIAVPAIGDGAVRQTIDGYRAARAANGKHDSRHRWSDGGRGSRSRTRMSDLRHGPAPCGDRMQVARTICGGTTTYQVA